MAKAKKASTKSKAAAKSGSATKAPGKKRAKAKKVAAAPRKAKSGPVRRAQKNAAAPVIRKSKKLPPTYSAVTDAASKTVNLSGNGQAVGIHMKSFDAVASILAAMQHAKNLKSSTISIRFSGVPGVKIPAQSFPDVADAISVFGLNAARRSEQSKPAVATEAEKAEEVKPATRAKAAEAQKSNIITKDAATTASEPVVKSRRRSQSSVESVDQIPDWFTQGFQDEYSNSDPEFTLRRTRLSLDPENSKNVIGAWEKPGDISGWGYEIVSGGKHVAWVIAEDPRRLLITGAPGLPPSPHSAIIGAIARIANLVVPTFNGTA